MRNAISLTLIGAAIACIIATPFISPDSTSARLMFDYWPVYALALLMVTTGVALSHTRKDDT